MAEDRFKGDPIRMNSPANNAAAVTPADGSDIANASRAIYIGGSGDLKVDMVGGQTAIVFSGLNAGSLLPLRVKRIYATDTTATNIVVVW